MNELNRKKNIDNKKYILKENLDCFGLNKIFINKFLTGLWNYPEAMYHILNHSDPRDIKDSLAFLIVDNFYTNNLSGNYIENNLLYILTLMIKDEIDKLTDIEEVETFLDNTRCGYLLEELQKKSDIQLFFNKVILKTIEKIETFCSYREIKFNVSQIVNEFEKLKEEYEKGEKKSGTKTEICLNEDIYKKLVSNKLDQSMNYCRDDNDSKGKIKEDSEYFVKKYVPNISISEFQLKGEKAKNEKNDDLYEYFHHFEEDMKKSGDDEMYSNSNLMGNLLNTSSPPSILTFYRTDFMQVVDFIEQLIEDLIQNILLLPYSVKCICKIISVLIRNKFKNISKVEENGFISKFILGRLLIPIISSPSFNALISDFVISGNTLKNIKTINIIISKLFSGKLFKNDSKDGDYTPFNWIFLDKMEKILYFYESAKNVYLPEFIEKYINNDLPNDYQYDYFEENKEEMYANISICFNIRYLSLLIEGIKKSPEIFNNKNKKADKLKKAFNKLEDEDNFKELTKAEKNLTENAGPKKRNSIKVKSKEQLKEKDSDYEIYYLHLDKAIEGKFEILFKIDNKIANFYIDLKQIEKQKTLNEEEKNIIKVKNYLSSSIGNYRLLNIADFHKEATSSTIKMLTEIKAYMALPNFILNNNTIPSTWYINSLLSYLDKIPQEYKNNEYEKLFNELTNDLNESIDILDFQKLIIFRNKLKFIDKINNYYYNVQNLIKKISINEKIKNFVENIFIPVEMSFKYIEDEKDNKFEIKASSLKEKYFEDKTFIEEPKKNITTYKTIESFASHFPNLSKYQLLQDKNPLEIIEELKIPGKINHYFDIIKEKMLKKENIQASEYEELYQEKIKDYIMNKIYEKIYPLEPLELDTKIFKKSTMLSWVEPQLIVDKDYIYDNILPDIINEFKKIYKVKTPLKKLKCIREIFLLIQSLIRFNEGENKTMIGSDDVTPVLNYAFIKAAPFRIFTDLEFVKIFLEIKEGQSGYDINQLESAYTMLLSYKAESFKLTPEEYKKRLEDAASNADYLNNK